MVKKRRKSRKKVPRLKTHYSGGLPKRIIGSTARHYASMAMGIDPFTQTIITEAIEELIREGYKIDLDIDICIANIWHIMRRTAKYYTKRNRKMKMKSYLKRLVREYCTRR